MQYRNISIFAMIAVMTFTSLRINPLLSGIRRFTEFDEEAVNCADFITGPIPSELRTSAVFDMQVKQYFHHQQMLRQIVTMDKEGKHFFQRNWEPSYSCTATVRMGCPGDGGKWICDPHHALSGLDCVVYSVGSHDEFSFEEAVHRFNPACEIYTFDPTLDGPPLNKPSYVHFYPWRLGSGESNSSVSIAGIMWALGHSNVSVLKIDCEGCEFDSFAAPGFAGAIQQILVEVHFNGEPQRVHRLFNFLSSMGYAIFSKEPNTQYSDGNAVEYSLVHMGAKFK